MIQENTKEFGVVFKEMADWHDALYKYRIRLATPERHKEEQDSLFTFMECPENKPN